jgi:hypothetical protein
MATVVTGLKKMVSDKTLSNMKDYHIPVLIFMFLCGIPVAWFGHLDMAFVAFTTAIVGGLTGQAFSPAQRDKKESDASPDSTSTSAPSASSGTSDSN